MLYEWFDAIDTLSPKAYKEMMQAIWRYQLTGEEPHKFQGKSAIVAAVIFPYITRRRSASKAAKIGISTRVTPYDAKEKLAEYFEKYPSYH